MENGVKNPEKLILCNHSLKTTSLLLYSSPKSIHNLKENIRKAQIQSGTPLQYSCLENPMDGGTWWAAVHGIAKSQTRLSDFPFPFHFHALEKEMATHSSVLAWRLPGTGEPGGLPSMGSHRVAHDWSDLAAAAAAGTLETCRAVWLQLHLEQCLSTAQQGQLHGCVAYRVTQGPTLRRALLLV